MREWGVTALRGGGALVAAAVRTMEEKGLVRHRVEGRTFIYQPVRRREETVGRVVSAVVCRVVLAAIDQLVQSALSLRRPTAAELTKLEELIRQQKAGKIGRASCRERA